MSPSRHCAAVTGPDAPVRSTIVAADWTRLATAYRTRAALHIVDDLLPDRRRHRRRRHAAHRVPCRRCAIANRPGAAIFWLIT